MPRCGSIPEPRSSSVRPGCAAALAISRSGRTADIPTCTCPRWATGVWRLPTAPPSPPPRPPDPTDAAVALSCGQHLPQPLADVPLPALLRSLEGELVLRHEAGVLQCEPSALASRGQGPGDHSIQRRRLGSAPPRVAPPVFPLQLQHLAVHDPVPPLAGFHSESEAVAHRRLHIGAHEPLAQQLRIGEGTPDFRRRIGEIVLLVNRLSFCLGRHSSISLSNA